MRSPYDAEIVQIRLKHVLPVRDQEKSISQAARDAEVDWKTMKSWVARYEDEGIHGLLNKPRGGSNPVSEEEKQQIIDLKKGNRHVTPQGPHEVLEDGVAASISHLTDIFEHLDGTEMVQSILFLDMVPERVQLTLPFFASIVFRRESALKVLPGCLPVNSLFFCDLADRHPQTVFVFHIVPLRLHYHGPPPVAYARDGGGEFYSAENGENSTGDDIYQFCELRNGTSSFLRKSNIALAIMRCQEPQLGEEP